MAPLRVAYQGVPGAYSQLAVEKAYANCVAVPCDEFENAFQSLDSAHARTTKNTLIIVLQNMAQYNLMMAIDLLLQAVQKGIVDRAVLPIENSLGGSIHRNHDLLLRHSLHIVGEVKVIVRHCLLANHGVKLEHVKQVLSHPQALAQCENTLAKLGIAREAANDTAGSAQYIAANQLKDVGAIASATAAVIYGLNILIEDIQDNSCNITRFLLLSREPITPSIDKPFKTSIVISLDEGPGALFKALAVFSLRQINLTKFGLKIKQIESRPIRDASDSSLCFNYFFHLDIEASTADQNMQNALRHLEEFATSVRVLGSYPLDNSMT